MRRYVLWEDGHYDWQGLPRKLHDQLNGRQRSLPGVERLAIGPGGGYWARFLDGSTRWHGLPHQCSAAIARRMDEGWTVEQVALGGSVDCPSWAFAYS